MSEDSVATLAIDIGGTGIKLMVLDGKGTPLSERFRMPTPRPARPGSVMGAIGIGLANIRAFDRVSVGFPGVIIDGVVKTAPNLDGEWADFPLASELSVLTGKPTRAANDADIQGLGVIEGTGVELVLTLGTGMGAGLFVDGRLVPNLELAHHPFRGKKTYEECLGVAALEKHGKKKWKKRVDQAIAQLGPIFNYRMLYLGGGNAKKLDHSLPSNVRIVDNLAGLLGGIKLWRD